LAKYRFSSEMCTYTKRPLVFRTCSAALYRPIAASYLSPLNA
jgi:hypothetical protein